jgi:hypothetical protein
MGIRKISGMLATSNLGNLALIARHSFSKAATLLGTNSIEMVCMSFNLASKNLAEERKTASVEIGAN